jgi:hypothetical protein
LEEVTHEGSAENDIPAACCSSNNRCDFRHAARLVCLRRAGEGEQLPDNAYEDSTTAGALLVMQAAHWFRFSPVRIPFQGSNVLLNHLLLFFGRLTFIFGGALFSVVLFRHLPAIDSSVKMWLMARRGLVFVITLFALFCMTLELERLGHAIGSGQRS